MKQLVALLLTLLSVTAYGQTTQYHRLPVIGQAEVLPNSYHRIDTDTQPTSVLPEFWKKFSPSWKKYWKNT